MTNQFQFDPGRPGLGAAGRFPIVPLPFQERPSTPPESPPAWDACRQTLDVCRESLQELMAARADLRNADRSVQSAARDLADSGQRISDLFKQISAVSLFAGLCTLLAFVAAFRALRACRALNGAMADAIEQGLQQAGERLARTRGDRPDDLEQRIRTALAQWQDAAGSRQEATIRDVVRANFDNASRELRALQDEVRQAVHEFRASSGEAELRPAPAADSRRDLEELTADHDRQLRRVQDELDRALAETQRLRTALDERAAEQERRQADVAAAARQVERPTADLQRRDDEEQRREAAWRQCQADMDCRARELEDQAARLDQSRREVQEAQQQVADADRRAREREQQAREQAQQAAREQQRARELQVEAERLQTQARQICEGSWPAVFRHGPLANWRERIESHLTDPGSAAPLLFAAMFKYHTLNRRDDTKELPEALQDVSRFAYQFWAAGGLDDDAQGQTAESWARAFEAELNGKYFSAFAGSVTHITAAANRFDQATLGLRQAAQHLEGQLQLMPETFRLLKAATEASVNTLHAAGPDLRAAATAFHTAVHTDFVVAAQRHRETVESLARSAADVRKCTADLATGGAGLRAAVDAQAASFRILNTSLTAEVLPAHREFHQRLERLSEETGKLLSPVAELQRHVAALLGELETLGPQLTPAATGFREASTAFQQAVQHDFAPSVATHRALAEALQTAVTSLTGSMEQFAQGTAVLAGAAHRHERTAQALERSVREHLTPAQAGLGTAAATLHGAGQELQQQLVSLRESGAAWRAEQGRLLAQWHGVATGLAPAVGAFCDAVGRDFTTAAASHHASAGLLQQSAAQFHATLQLLNDATGNITQEYVRWNQGLRPLGDALTETLTETTALVRQLQQSVTHDLAPAQAALRTSAHSLQDATARLGGFTQVLDPVASKLTNLDATLARLADTVAAIQRFAEIRGQLDQLAAALLRVSHVAVAIGALPEQLRLVLKELVDTQRKTAEA